MAKINQLVAALRRWLRRRDDVPDGAQMNYDAGRIDDGVNYGMPVTLPGYVREALSRAGKLATFLEDASFRFQFDRPYRSSLDAPVRPVVEDPLLEWNWSTREYVLTNTHNAYDRNPIANRGVKYMRSYIIGEGFTLVAKNDLVDEVLQAFIDNSDNAIREYERQAPIDLLLDGELMLRLYETAGEVTAVPLRPWECHWIETEPGFFRRLQTYHFQRYITAGDAPYNRRETITEDVPARDILFVAINRRAYELRGKPELYPILPWLQAYKEWLENRARQNHWRNALLWHVSIEGGTASQVAAVAARYQKPPTPGSVAVTSSREKIVPLSNPVGGSEAGEDGRQIKLMSAVGLGLPEYMLADGANANLASSTNQELPALMTFGDFQNVLIRQLWQPLFSRVLQVAVDAGRLPPTVPELDSNGDPTGEQIETIKAFDVAYPPVQSTDVVNIAQAMDAALRNGLVSRETASEEMGFDWVKERTRIENERKADMDAMMRGEIPMPPTMMPDDEQDEDDAVPDEADTENPEPGREG